MVQSRAVAPHIAGFIASLPRADVRARGGELVMTRRWRIELRPPSGPIRVLPAGSGAVPSLFPARLCRETVALAIDAVSCSAQFVDKMHAHASRRVCRTSGIGGRT